MASLVKQIDGLVDAPADGDKFRKAFLVLLTDDPEDAEEQLKKLNEKLKLKNVPLTFFDGIRGPKGYRIGKKAAVTVMMWDESVVVYNYALGRNELDRDAIKSIVTEAKVFFQSAAKSRDSSSGEQSQEAAKAG